MLAEVKIRTEVDRFGIYFGGRIDRTRLAIDRTRLAVGHRERKKSGNTLRFMLMQLHRW